MTKRILLRLLDRYRYWISPVVHSLSPTGCKFHPSCSQYASEAIALHGAAAGGWLAMRRLLRCHPFTRGGFDPVPVSELRENRNTNDINQPSKDDLSKREFSGMAASRSGALREPLP